MKRYRHIFFDLDHTLWDFRANSRATLRELHAELGLADRGIDAAEELIEAYEEVNAGLWRRYEAGRIPKEVLRVLRFRNTLGRFGVRDERLANRLATDYMDRCPRKSALHAGVRALLDDLATDHALHIITNGFQEVQRVKLMSSGITAHFDVVLTSEEAGAAKPDPRIFRRALELAGAGAEESLMVGDDARNDTGGARGAGLDQAHFIGEEGTVPDAEATYRFTHFAELHRLLRG